VRVGDAGDLARAVRAARNRRAMSQADLAAAAGVSRRWLVASEAGKPRAELLAAVGRDSPGASTTSTCACRPHEVPACSLSAPAC
jgi:hypothetical protein